LSKPNRFNWIADQLFLPGMVRRCGADVFLATDFNSYLTPSSGVKVVSIVYDLIQFIFPQSMSAQPLSVRFGWRTNFAKLRRSQQIIAISESTKSDLLSYWGTDPDAVRVVYPGIDHRLFSPEAAKNEVLWHEVAARYGVAGRYFVYVGGTDWRKNLDGMLEALRGMPVDMRLALLGKETVTDRELHSRIRELGLNERVILCGYVAEADLPILYGRAVALVFPSRYEGFGFPVVEAMASGCPVITSNVSSMPEVAGDAALLVNPEHVDAIRDAMVRLASDEELCRELRRRGIMQAAGFSWSKAAQETLELLREVAGES
jgi:glycosyltransferase involved in cell wall biosynthesis